MLRTCWRSLLPDEKVAAICYAAFALFVLLGAVL